MMAIGIINIPRFARIVRASVMDEFGKDYVTAARAVGGNCVQLHPEVIIDEVDPELLGVAAFQGVDAAVDTGAARSILGLL